MKVINTFLRSRWVKTVAIPDILKASAAWAFLVSVAMAIMSEVVSLLIGLSQGMLTLACLYHIYRYPGVSILAAMLWLEVLLPYGRGMVVVVFDNIGACLGMAELVNTIVPTIPSTVVVTCSYRNVR